MKKTYLCKLIMKKWKSIIIFTSITKPISQISFFFFNGRVVTKSFKASSEEKRPKTQTPIEIRRSFRIRGMPQEYKHSPPHGFRLLGLLVWEMLFIEPALALANRENFGGFKEIFSWKGGIWWREFDKGWVFGIGIGVYEFESGECCVSCAGEDNGFEVFAL